MCFHRKIGKTGPNWRKILMATEIISTKTEKFTKTDHTIQENHQNKMERCMCLNSQYLIFLVCHFLF